MMSEVFEGYARTRTRVCDLVTDTSAEEQLRSVPACPAWRARDLLAHLVSMPAAIAAGRRPDGDIGSWLDSLIAERTTQSIATMVAEWQSLDVALRALLEGPSAVMFGDLVVHEHDLRGALGRPDHTAFEEALMLPRTLAAFSKPLQAAKLGAIEVHDRGRVWRSHPDQAGWTLQVDSWTAMRAVNSRRTAAELRALPSVGDINPYLAVLDAHLPLPLQSLGE